MTTSIATAQNLKELALEYMEYIQELMDSNPSVSEDALEEFISIQEWGEKLQRKVKRKGLTWEQVEMAADEMENN